MVVSSLYIMRHMTLLLYFWCNSPRKTVPWLQSSLTCCTIIDFLADSACLNHRSIPNVKSCIKQFSVVICNVNQNGTAKKIEGECVFVCVCARERERKRAKEMAIELQGIRESSVFCRRVFQYLTWDVGQFACYYFVRAQLSCKISINYLVC